MKTDLFAVTMLTLAACAGLNPEARRFLDSTSHLDAPPSWVTETKTSWEEDGKVLVRATYSVKGTERVNGCFDLARLDTKETILSEIANEVRGTIDNAQQSISEDAEVVLGKVRSAEYSGRITGLRFSDQYFERYLVGEIERVDCHVLGQLKLTDYNRIKREVVDKIVQVDPKLKEAINKKQIEFFSKEKKEDQ